MTVPYKIFGTSLLLFCMAAFGQPANVIVVYETPEPSQEAIYVGVIQGIENILGPIDKLEVPQGAADIQAQLDVARPATVVALGRAATDLVDKSSYRQKSLAGLFPFGSSEHRGVSLLMDGKAVAAEISRLIPSVKKVFIVQQQGFRIIADSGDQTGNTPKIVMLDGEDSLATIRTLGNLLETDVGPSDAVIIPPNLPDDIMFKVGLVAWDKKIKLFSSNMWHLENGVLMIFYPNTVAFGEQIGSFVKSQRTGYETAKNIDIGLNRRLAQHLGVEFKKSDEDKFAVKIK